MFSINYSAYHHADHPRVRRLASRLAQIVQPYLVNGQIPTEGELPAHLAEESQKIFDELEALQTINKRGN